MSQEAEPIAGDDLSPLAWVQGELRRTLNSAHKALRRYVREIETVGGFDVDSADPAVLRNARVQLHQGVGALELVGLPVVAQVLRAGEAAVQRMVARPKLATPKAVETIEQASFAVLDYLGRTLAGKPVATLALFPQYAAVQALAGAERVHPADLWDADWQWHPLPADHRVKPRPANDAARAEMEGLVLALMRGADPAAPLRMSHLCAELGAGADGELGTLWHLASAFFEAQAAHLISADVYTKRVASRLLSQLRAAITGEAAASDRLAQDLLFYCMRATLSHPAQQLRLAAVQSAWPVDARAREDYDTPRLGLVDPALVLQARKRMASAKDVWSAVAGGELHRLAALGESFALLSDAVQQLFTDAAPLASALRSAAARCIQTQQQPEPELAMEVATAILYLDAVLEDGELDHPVLSERMLRLAVRIRDVDAGRPPQPLEAWMEDVYRRISERQTMGSVVQELRTALSDVEKQIDPYFRDPSQRDLLMPVPAQLQAMQGVFSVLGLDQAAQSVRHIRHSVDTLLQTADDPAHAVQGGTFERLANNLGALSFLIDMLSVQPKLAKSLFKFDNRTGAFSSVMGTRQRSALASLDTADEPQDDAEVTSAEGEGGLAFPPVLSLASVVVPAAAPAAPAVASGLEDDAEMRETFLEEAREVIAAARASLAQLALDSDDLLELTTVRRAFHTLKGSSRMVGLAAFGEASWRCEQLYNDRLAQSACMDEPLATLSEQALDYLADWIEAIADGVDRGHNTEAVAEAADALRLEGRLLPVRPVPSATEDAADEPAPLAQGEHELADTGPAEGAPEAPAASPPLPSPLLAPLLAPPVASPPVSSPELAARVPNLPSASDLDLLSPSLGSAWSLPEVQEVQEVQEVPDVPEAPEVQEEPASAETAFLPTSFDAGNPLGHLDDIADISLDPVPLMSGSEAFLQMLADVEDVAKPVPRLPNNLNAPNAPNTPNLPVKAANPYPAQAGTSTPEFTLALKPLDDAPVARTGAADPGAARSPVRDDPDALPTEWLATTPADLSLTEPAALDTAEALPLTVDEFQLAFEDVLPARDAPALVPLNAPPPPPAPPIPTDPPASSFAATAFGDTAFGDTALMPELGPEPEPVPVPMLALQVEPEPEPEPIGTLDAVPAAAAWDLQPVETPSADDEVKIVGPLRIAIPLFNIFLNEADEQSRRLATEVAEWSLEPHHAVAETTIALAHSLAGNSGTVGFADLSLLARSLEHALMRSRAIGRASDGEPALFTDAANEIRALLHQFAAGILKPVSEALLARLLAHEVASASQRRDTQPPLLDDDSLSGPLSQPAPLSAQPGEPSEADEGVAVDAIDADLFPIFEDEADELLPQLRARLSDWAREPGDADLAAACMRTLHTFKGGARLTGAMRVGALAHRLETDIERLVGQADADEAAIAHLLAQADAMAAAFEQLREPRRGGPATGAQEAHEAHEVQEAQTSAALPLPPSETVEAAEDAAVGVETMPDTADSVVSPPAPVSSPPTLPPPPSSPSWPSQLTPLAAPVAERLPAEPPQPDDVAAPGDAEPAPGIDWSRFSGAGAVVDSLADAAEDMAPGTAPGTVSGTPTSAQAATVRVRAPLLDRLVNQSGEVSITRARIESEMQVLQGSLEDLTDTLEKLRRHLRDIELQAETQISSRMEAAKASAQAFDPLEMDRFTRSQELTRMMAESVNDVAAVQRGLQRALQATEDELALQARLMRQLQRDLLGTRMVAFESLSDRLQRVVRLAAKDTGKLVRLEIVGGSIEVDRSVLERMVGPFEHLLRNSVVHGIETPADRVAAGKPETGTITLAVAQQGNEVAIAVSDEGAGLDLARLRARAVERGLLSAEAEPTDTELAQLIFVPGLSTVETVTGLAGRGVGMDVVRAEVVAMGGRIEISTQAGQGTGLRLLLPLTTAVTQVVMLRFGERQVAVPSILVELVRREKPAVIEASYAQGHFVHNGEPLPFYWLGALLQAEGRGALAGRAQTVIVLRSAAQRVVVHVDEVLGSREVMVKNVGPQLSRLPGLAGMTLLPSGAVATLYNPVALAAVYGQDARRRQQPAQDAAQDAAHDAAHDAAQESPAVVAPAPVAAPAALVPLVMVVDDSLTVRRVTQRLLVREGYRVALAKDGLDALEQLAEERPAVLLSDIEMPRMDGFDLVRNVRADPRLADLPVIMITSRIAQKHRDYAAELGVDHYLGKPYAEDELLTLVARHVQARSTLWT